MTPSEIQALPVAVLNSHHECVCSACAPIVGDRAPYRQDLNAAPLLAIDPRRPELAVCPGCRARHQTPAATAIAMLSAEVQELREMVARLLAVRTL